MSLDLADYKMTFADEFRDLNGVTAGGPSTWICHTPWHGDFGNSIFTDIDASVPHVFPFQLYADQLKIHMKKGADGKWRSGLLSAVDYQNRGFAQAGGGWFGCRMKVPDVDGTWPAFWLGSMDYADGLQHEIDIIEYYGHANTGYFVNCHIWDKNPGKPLEFHKQAVVHVPAGSLSTGFHTFSAMVLPGEVVFYLESVEVARMTVPASFYEKKFFPMVNLAAGGGWPITNLQDCYMVVDYIRVYKAP